MFLNNSEDIIYVGKITFKRIKGYLTENYLFKICITTGSKSELKA